MEAFATALAAIEQLKREGVVDEYAIGGAMALVFWTEPTTTYDVDVFVLMQSSGIIFSLEPIYAWAARHGYAVDAEHIVVAGVPLQTIPAHNTLTIEAVKAAADLHYEDQPVRVIRPEYLIAMALDGSARSAKEWPVWRRCSRGMKSIVIC